MVTKREWLAERGLAKPNSRGRFSAEAVSAVDEAIKNGMVFDEPVKVAAAPTPKPPKAQKQAKAVSPGIRLPESLKAKLDQANAGKAKPVAKAYDPKAVRDWAAKNGHTVGERGRLSSDIVNAYLASIGDKAEIHVPEVNETKKRVVSGPTPKDVMEKKPKEPEKPVRDEKFAWGLTAVRNPQWETPAPIQFSSCQECHKPIQYCPGHGPNKMPQLPKYLGGGDMSFQKPKV